MTIHVPLTNARHEVVTAIISVQDDEALVVLQSVNLPTLYVSREHLTVRVLD